MKKNFHPTNVDLLNFGNECNLTCRQCYFTEDCATKKRNSEHDLRLADKLITVFTGSSIFIYPKEITTSMELSPLLSRVGQKSVLSNGILLNEKKIDLLIESGIKQIKITLFSSYPEQRFFNQISKAQYGKIIENIQLCKRKGLSIVINTVLSRITKKSIVELANKCFDLGVDKIEFLRLIPFGSAEKIESDIFLDENDMLEIIQTVEHCKTRYPQIYFKFNLNCGPDFYNKTERQAVEKVKNAKKEWTKSMYLCPVIDGNYLGISSRSDNVYSCFLAMNHPEFVIGKINSENGVLSLLKDYQLDSSTLSEKLRGNCHKNNCQYQKICLGGCRSTAFIFAKLKAEAEPMFAGMDICITKCKEKLAL